MAFFITFYGLVLRLFITESGSAGYAKDTGSTLIVTLAIQPHHSDSGQKRERVIERKPQERDHPETGKP